MTKLSIGETLKEGQLLRALEDYTSQPPLGSDYLEDGSETNLLHLVKGDILQIPYDSQVNEKGGIAAQNLYKKDAVYIVHASKFEVLETVGNLIFWSNNRFQSLSDLTDEEIEGMKQLFDEHYNERKRIPS